MAMLALVIQALLGLTTLFITNLLWSYYNSPLKPIPGPFVAKFTNLWRFFDVWGGRPELTLRKLHQRYGSAVRIGPNIVSLSDPRLIKTIYSTRGEYLKSEFYKVNDVKSGKAIISNIFGTLSNDYHAVQLKPIQRHYTLNALIDLEPLIDKTINTFRQKIEERFVDTGKVCNIGDWLLFCTTLTIPLPEDGAYLLTILAVAWDVTGEITFSQPMGFLDTGADVEHILSGADRSLDYFAVIGQIPQLDFLLDKNPIHRIGPQSFGTVVTMSIQRAIARVKGTDQHPPGGQKDFLDQFIEKKKEADWIDDNQVVSWLCINMLAGSDTTAITLRAIVYYVLKNPDVHHKLLQELDAANLRVPVPYRAVQSLLYLGAVIEEATRMHPAVGLLLERVVPAQGLTLPGGRFIAPGTIVGLNAWVVHRDKIVFGQDAESFNPERWLQGPDETTTEFESRRSRMREANLTFGGGNRVCLGKNLSTLEIYKFIATLFLIYQIELVDPAKEWHVQNSWFVRQSGIEVTIKRRK